MLRFSVIVATVSGVEEEEEVPEGGGGGTPQEKAIREDVIPSQTCIL